MKIKRYLIPLGLIIILMFAFLLKISNQNSRALSRVNEYDSNRFFSTLSYFQQVDELLSNGQTNILKNDIDSQISNIQNALIAITDTISDYNYIYSKNIQEPQQLMLWLKNLKSELANYKNGDKLPNSELTNIKSNLDKINSISLSVYNFKDGIQKDLREELNKSGFLKDGRWIKWMNEADSELLVIAH